MRGAPLDADGRHLRDAEGRIALLRGVNARVEGVFDVSFDDGRVALEEIPALEAADCERMRALGLGLLRLPINWSGVEPEQGRIDGDYLARVDEAVECAAAAGLLVLIDLHQDAYSKEIGEDGAPLWAIVPAPDELLEGPLDDLDARRQSRQVLDAFDSFFAAGDPHGLQAAFIAMLAEVAATWRDHPAVIGFEIFNEPVAAPAELEAFHGAAAAALREAAPEKLVFFEPPAVRNFLDSQPLASAPFPVAGAVYAPHAYTYVFGDQGAQLEALTKDDLRFGIENARAEADAWGTPLLVGELGIGPSQPNADAWMQWQQELHDEVLASNAFWVWKESSQGSWGVFDLVDGAWVERPQVIDWISRVHAERIAADDARLDWRDGALEITPDGPFDAPTSIYVPASSADTFRLECDGDAVPSPSRDGATGLVDVVCAGRLVVRP
ncbi:MAG TPA: cellulase family glycosylhydrolase [Kofleriaceae bacterium]|nr:cellulase family glycosylhydrolase [Kofleriaceae bacterium]